MLKDNNLVFNLGNNCFVSPEGKRRERAGHCQDGDVPRRLQAPWIMAVSAVLLLSPRWQRTLLPWISQARLLETLQPLRVA